MIDNDIWENVVKFPINDDVESILNGIDGLNQILANQSFYVIVHRMLEDIY